MHLHGARRRDPLDIVRRVRCSRPVQTKLFLDEYGQSFYRIGMLLSYIIGYIYHLVCWYVALPCVMNRGVANANACMSVFCVDAMLLHPRHGAGRVMLVCVLFRRFACLRSSFGLSCSFLASRPTRQRLSTNCALFSFFHFLAEPSAPTPPPPSNQPLPPPSRASYLYASSYFELWNSTQPKELPIPSDFEYSVSKNLVLRTLPAPVQAHVSCRSRSPQPCSLPPFSSFTQVSCTTTTRWLFCDC